MAGFYPLGMRVIEDVNLVTAQPLVVNLTWRQRLFSWPWRPWESTKVVVQYVPDQRVYAKDDSTIVCHPVIAQKIKEVLKVQED